MPFLAYQQIAVNTVTAQSVTQLTVPLQTQYALIQADIAGSIRYTLNGTGSGNTPTNTVGMILAPNTPPQTIRSPDIQNLKFIGGTANTSLNIHYYN